jgi:hypothetical protein
MLAEIAEEQFELNDAEVETLRRAAEARKLPFDPQKRSLTRRELRGYGLVREAYTTEELRAAGFGPAAVTSFDQAALSARDALRVDAPFGSGIAKWQLPVNMLELRVFQTVFPPDTLVAPHVHPVNTEQDPGGSLRIVVKGSISYEGRTFRPGDWFYVPNGESYTFRSSPDEETTVMYLYRFFAATEGNRFSHPHAA